MSTLDIIVEKLEKAHNYGKYISALCPFHDDKKPSFFVYEDTYRCLSCGAHGSTQSLIRKLSSLPERYRVYDTKESRNPFTKWGKSQSLSSTIEIANRILKSRPSHFLQRRKVLSEIQFNLVLGLLEGYITFPIFNKWGELSGAVARVGENQTASAKYYVPKGQDPKLLYVPSWKRIKENKEVFVTFGIIDAISLYIMGFASASTTTGQSVSPEAFDSIRKKIIFIPDKHEEVSALKVAAKLGWRGDTLFLNYPLHCKDVNDYFVADKEGLYAELGRCFRDSNWIGARQAVSV